MSDLGRFLEDGVGLPILFNNKVPSNQTRFIIYTSDDGGLVYPNATFTVSSPIFGTQTLTSDSTGMCTFQGLYGAYTFTGQLNVLGFLTQIRTYNSVGGDTVILTYLYTRATTKRIQYTSSTSIVFAKHLSLVDIFLVGGGGAGGTTNSSTREGSGGGGGYTKVVGSVPTIFGTSYPLVIGAGGGGGGGGTTSFLGYSSLGGAVGLASNITTGCRGGDGGSGGGAYAYTGGYYNGGNGGSNGSNGVASGGYTGGTGQGRNTYEFESGSGTLYSGGGGSTSEYTAPSFGSGGAGGGGNGFSGLGGAGGNATFYGGGGGGGSYSGGSGGSGYQGIVVVRWA